MVKKRIEKKIKKDPISVITLILAVTVLMLGVLVYMHQSQGSQIQKLEADIERLDAERNIR